jgi:hypothetical protein
MKVRRLLVGAGAATVLLSGLLPWLRFQRSELSGFRLAELVASVGDDYRLGPPSWLGIAWYVLPLAAIAAWLALVLAHPSRVVLRIHLPLGLVMLAMSVTFVVAAHRTVGVQSGEVLAVLGAAMVVAGATPRRAARPVASPQWAERPTPQR